MLCIIALLGLLVIATTDPEVSLKGIKTMTVISTVSGLGLFIKSLFMKSDIEFQKWKMDQSNIY